MERNKIRQKERKKWRETKLDKKNEENWGTEKNEIGWIEWDKAKEWRKMKEKREKEIY